MKDKIGCYAVIFTSKLRSNVLGYFEMAEKMERLASKQKGFLGIDSARGEIGISISYGETLEDIANWKENQDHLMAQEKGIKEWYASYELKIARVERAYDFKFQGM